MRASTALRGIVLPLALWGASLGAAEACWPWIAGRAVCADGYPASDLSVAIHRNADGFCGSGNYADVTDASGEFSVCVMCSGETSVTIAGQTRTRYVGDYTDFGTWTVDCSADADLDGVADTLERHLAQKHSPVLHKHSLDSQADLGDIDLVLPQSRSIIWDIYGNKVWDEPLSSTLLHASDTWEFCTMADDSLFLRMYVDFPDSLRLAGAPAGQRPLYYHVYADGPYLFLQYWYFLHFNDLRDQTNNHTWHEGDWEHVTLRLIPQGTDWVPDLVNFYQHDGGHTRSAAQAWWSPTATASYTALQQGYDATRTHLHVWIAADSHASYNRYDPVYHFELSNLFGIGNDQVTDNADYAPAGFDLYFRYDLLKNMGEVETRPDNHGGDGRTFDLHRFHRPVDQTFQWLRYVGRLGDNWIGAFGCPWGTEKPQTPAPHTPATGEISHEWIEFTVNTSAGGFGNTGGDGCFLFSDGGAVSWVADPPDGDGVDVDADGDGWISTVDCNDNDPLVNPGRPERCSTPYDDDCDGAVNEGCVPCYDADWDGWTTCERDCNDANPTVHPGASESCDTSFDDDCDGSVNEGCRPRSCGAKCDDVTQP